MDKVSYLGSADINAIEFLYNQYCLDPESVDEGWKKFFEGFEFAKTVYDAEGSIPENFQKEFKVINLINGYRTRGHLFTKTNPVRERRQYSPTLAIENFGLKETDLLEKFQAGNDLGLGIATLKQIISHLELSYCLSIGSEFMYIRTPRRLEWLKSKLEAVNKPVYSKEQKLGIFNKLNQAASFEHFLGKKFVGQKRFSIEGGEALIPALDALINKGSELGLGYFVMGMAHRGRLNTLANIFQKRPCPNLFYIPI